jgi:exodeoxyribonuclease VII large subunit
VQQNRVRFAVQGGRLNARTLDQRTRELRGTLVNAQQRLALAMSRQVAVKSERYGSLSKLFNALNYTSVLERGFAVVTDIDGHLVKRAAEVAPGQRLKIRFSDDTLEAAARKTSGQGELF